MAALSKVLRSVEGGGLQFFCPGCKTTHLIYHGAGPGARWSWNGNAEKPTFSPSVLVRNGHHVPNFNQGKGCWCTYYAEHPEEKQHFKCLACHSFVTDGRIQFLSDCSHELAGQTVDLPELTEDLIKL